MKKYRTHFSIFVLSILLCSKHAFAFYTNECDFYLAGVKPNHPTSLSYSEALKAVNLDEFNKLGKARTVLRKEHHHINESNKLISEYKFKAYQYFFRETVKKPNVFGAAYIEKEDFAGVIPIDKIPNPEDFEYDLTKKDAAKRLDILISEHFSPLSPAQIKTLADRWGQSSLLLEWYQNRLWYLDERLAAESWKRALPIVEHELKNINSSEFLAMISRNPVLENMKSLKALGTDISKGVPLALSYEVTRNMLFLASAALDDGLDIVPTTQEALAVTLRSPLSDNLNRLKGTGSRDQEKADIHFLDQNELNRYPTTLLDRIVRDPPYAIKLPHKNTGLVSWICCFKGCSGCERLRTRENLDVEKLLSPLFQAEFSSLDAFHLESELVGVGAWNE
jgi:hypothetical protein